MAGIYIHIPFCKSACHYCNFHFSTSKKNRNDYVGALLKEINQKKTIFDQFILPDYPEIKTLYFGGGTPSQLSTENISQIINAVYKNYPIANDLELSIEANPDDLTEGTLQSYMGMGINRLSIGIQSFNTEDLLYLNRTHDSSMAENCIKKAQDKGLHNINIDLIYGIPSQNQKSWETNLKNFFDFDLPHLSAYCLTIEPKTPLAVLIKKNISKGVNESESIKHFKMLTRTMQSHNYLHYEISNFCKQGSHSKHNLSYWQQKPYLGFGASSHSFYKNTRSWNIANTSQYIYRINNNMPFSESETLSLNTQFNEYIMTSLRTMWGCNLDYINKQFGDNYLKRFLKQTTKPDYKQFILKKENTILLSQKGKLFADKLASDFFYSLTRINLSVRF